MNLLREVKQTQTTKSSHLDKNTEKFVLEICMCMKMKYVNMHFQGSCGMCQYKNVMQFDRSCI